MQLEAYPIEGDFIQTNRGDFFEVKGFHQPLPDEEKVMCFVRYSKKHQNNKIYSILDKFIYVRKILPQYIFSPNNYYFDLQAVPLKDIRKHLRPEKKLSKHLNYESTPSAALKDAVAFCKYLSKNTGISTGCLGITGSCLLGVENEHSDIDIIVYGYGNSLKVREHLHQCFSKPPDNKERLISRYNKNQLKELYKHRIENNSVSFLDFLKYEVRKLHQGTFGGRDFFIRFFEFKNREDYQKRNNFFKWQIQSLGRITVSGQVRDDQNWWTTPARISFANPSVLEKSNLIKDYQQILRNYDLELADLSNTFSLRGRYIENVRLLEFIKAQGTLELVTFSKNRAYLQLALGSSPEDYLIQM